MPKGPALPVSVFRLDPDTRRWLNRIGALFGVAGVVFVALRLASYADEIDAAGIGPGGYLALLSLAIVYGASNLLLALGWWRLLRCLGVTAARGWALRAYAISQLAKYVPGNIFQFAGRQAIGVAAGFGIPTAGMVIILGVDRILDMSRTAVNVTGDLVASIVLGGARAQADGTATASSDHAIP